MSPLGLLIHLGTLFLWGQVIAQGAGPRCPTGSYVRKEVRELSDTELVKLHTAFNRLKEDGTYDEFCRIHLDHVPFAHSTPYFLPWHREFTYRFEQELRRVSPGISLPYWDWSIDSQAPERSLIFTPKYFGTQGGRCLNDGPYAGWRSRFPDGHCLSRSFDGGENIGSFTSPEQLRFSLGRATNFEEFWDLIEANPHGNVHNNIGGDMATMGSCNDPLFYLHHSMIDKLWMNWQSLDGSFLNSFGGEAPGGGRARLDDELEPFRKSVRDVMNIPNEYCYSYSAGVKPIRRTANGNGRGRTRGRRSDLSINKSKPNAAPISTNPIAPVSQLALAPVNQLALAPGVSANPLSPLILSLQPVSSLAGTTAKVTPNPSSTLQANPDPNDRSDLAHLRNPSPLPLSFIRMFNLSESKVRANEEKLKAQTLELNRSGYQSPFSLGLNGLLGDIPGEIMKLVDKSVTGGTVTNFGEEFANVVSLKKPFLSSTDGNILRNLLFA